MVPQRWDFRGVILATQNQASVRMEVDSEECHRGISTDREERDTDVRRRIVEPWVWQRHGTTEVGLPGSHRSLALIKGERLVMNEAEKVENVEANSKYQDKT
ncbi:hypothetical protein C4D60_Mb07t16780 [Musa balbisiana]|uniref:Uncharacterized protein n=1 Tax=Musa balbisiana TaxID=52838 RepID=A0A4S8JG30_MUSBA|nr:hypothetical protein C4D60_Mb07t16780 [Musa balbisiana]